MRRILPTCWTNGVEPTRPPRSATSSSRAVSTRSFTGLWSTSSLSTEKTFSKAGILGAVHPQELFDLDGLEGVRLEVDDVDESWRVADDLVDRGVDPETGLAGHGEDRVVVADPVDGAGPEPGDQPDEAVGAPDSGRPTELVVGEGDPGDRRKEVLAEPGAHDLLDQDRHLLVKIEEAPFAPVGDGVRSEDRGVDLGHGVEDGPHALVLGALVGDEETAVLAGKRRSHPVFEKARRTDDERACRRPRRGSSTRP